MEDASKAKASIAALNDFNLKGNRIRVEVGVYHRFYWEIIHCLRFQRRHIAVQVVHRK